MQNGLKSGLEFEDSFLSMISDGGWLPIWGQGVLPVACRVETKIQAATWMISMSHSLAQQFLCQKISEVLRLWNTKSFGDLIQLWKNIATQVGLKKMGVPEVFLQKKVWKTKSKSIHWGKLYADLFSLVRFVVLLHLG